MRIMIRNEYGDDEIITKENVTFFKRDKVNVLSFHIYGDLCEIILPADKIFEIKQHLLEKGYLDARGIETVFE